MQFLIIIIAMLALMWVLMIRPQRRRQAEHRNLLENVGLGDEIITAGGLYGTVRGVEDDRITLEVAPGTNVRIARRAVAALLPPPALDEDEDEDEAVPPDGS